MYNIIIIVIYAHNMCHVSAACTVGNVSHVVILKILCDNTYIFKIHHTVVHTVPTDHEVDTSKNSVLEWTTENCTDG